MAIAHSCVPSWDEASKGYRQRLQQRMWFGLLVQHQTRDPYYYKEIIILLASVSRGREKSDHMKVLGHDPVMTDQHSSMQILSCRVQCLLLKMHHLSFSRLSLKDP